MGFTLKVFIFSTERFSFERRISSGKRLSEVRKDKKMSQDEVGKLVWVHGSVIGRYERDEVKPSIEMATQLAEALEVSLDYLVGATDILLKKSIVNRVLDIQKLNQNDKQHVFALLDAFIKQAKLQGIIIIKAVQNRGVYPAIDSLSFKYFNAIHIL